MKIPPTELRVMDFLPRRDSEENLKYRFARACETYGLKFYMDYPSRWNEAPGCRFDLVIYDGKYIKALIEIKKLSKNPARGEKWKRSRQCQKYLSFGVPVYLVYNDLDFTTVLNDL